MAFASLGVIEKKGASKAAMSPSIKWAPRALNYVHGLVLMTLIT